MRISVSGPLGIFLIENALIGIVEVITRLIVITAADNQLMNLAFPGEQRQWIGFFGSQNRIKSILIIIQFL